MKFRGCHFLYGSEELNPYLKLRQQQQSEEAFVETPQYNYQRNFSLFFKYSKHTFLTIKLVVVLLFF